MDYGVVRPLFGGRMTPAQVNGCDTILAASDGLDATWRAYLLATAFHETGQRMQPVRETFADTDEQAVVRLDAAWRKGQLPWVSVPYWNYDQTGKAWFGRGHVQLTHRDNYAKAGAKLNVDLLGYPSLALNPDVSAQILVRGCVEGWFTGKKLSDYLPGDYVGARRVVNGTDRAHLIARYAQTFEIALSGWEPLTDKDWWRWVSLNRFWKRLQKVLAR